MKRAHLLRTLALAVVLMGAASARADLISWGYKWEAFPTDVKAGSGKIEILPEGYHTVKGDSFVVAGNLKLHSTATTMAPDTFGPMDGMYSMKVTLTDLQSSQSGSLTFAGQFQGKFSEFNSSTTNSYGMPTTQSLVLGNSQFKVTMASYTPPGPPSQGNLGAMGAFVEVTSLGNPNPQGVPEPSTMALAGIGVGLAGVLAWRRRRRTRVGRS